MPVRWLHFLFWKLFIKFLCIFEKLDCFSLMRSCVSYLYVLNINPLQSIYFSNTFSHSVCWPFVLSVSSVQFSRSVVSDSLQPHELQHARPPCPSPTPGVHSNSHPSSQWCHPAISSSVIPFSSCPQSLLASESFPMSQLFVLSILSFKIFLKFK